ncbi:acetylglutamate kinase [Tieghemostelium lacteum]|uniref:Acetylglutamate kinase n=1 Tax=Tieghemostelium lacteum TaxID=361077 RepID=A0A151ZF97_TIELA|nr:acetylglutamate kinase [Tieghemostelium lacteum]|eukprot:KYQ92652.1 acetylglutamate kinase [Tieghemostelium lacteum]
MTTPSSQNRTNNNNNNNNNNHSISSKSNIPQSASVGSNLNKLTGHHHPTTYPNITQFKAIGHIISKSHHNQNSSSALSNSLSPLNQLHHHSNISHHSQQSQLTTTPPHHHHQTLITSTSPNQRVVDPDEEPINLRTFSGIFYTILIFVISFLPLFLIEKLLTLFAWVQLELLKAKGRGISPEQSYSKLKRKRKLLKKKKPQIILHKSPLSLKHHKSKGHKLSTSNNSTPTSSPTTVIENETSSNSDSQNHHSVFTTPTPTIKLTPIEPINEEIISQKQQQQQLLLDSASNFSMGSEDKPLYQVIEENESATSSSPKIVDESAQSLIAITNTNQSSLTMGTHNGSLSNGSSLNSSSENLLKLAAMNNIRQRSDSVTIIPPDMMPKPISEIRRVNSEATLYQTSEDTLLFEANQQSKKEFEDFLRSVKDIKDVHNWLKNFSGSASKKIAIVKISRRILDTPFGLESAASSLCFMYKFGLYPIVIHGGLNEISKLGMTKVIEERRNRSALLKEAIKKNGVGCTVLTPDICEIQPVIMQSSIENDCNSTSSLSEEELEFGENDILPSGGLTMKIDSFDYDLLTKAIDKGKIPIWDSVAETVDGVDYPINSDITTFELAKRIQPYKIIFACNDGGILDSDHKAIPVVYLDQDYKHLLSNTSHISNRRRVQLKQMKRIVDHLPSSTTLVVSSIENITHQLLFPRLANGTIVKKSEDNKVLIYDSSNFSQLDQTKLRILIEDSFGRPLSEDYFDYLKDTLHKLYLCVNSQGEYNGCAIVTFKNPDYIPYLCKFCVRKSTQGLGLGDLIWRILQRDNDKLYWRSRNNNPLNPWYFQRCQGSFRADESFTIFWYGDDKFEDGSHMIEAALNKPITIVPVAKA